MFKIKKNSHFELKIIELPDKNRYKLKDKYESC